MKKKRSIFYLLSVSGDYWFPNRLGKQSHRKFNTKRKAFNVAHSLMLQENKEVEVTKFFRYKGKALMTTYLFDPKDVVK